MGLSRLVFNESGSTSRVASPSDSISDCLIDVTLPQELITEILVRLPVKSLLRFKCVSKPWLSLISDPQFVSSHLSKSSSMEADSLNLQVLFETKIGMKRCSLYSALHEADPATHLSAIEFPARNSDCIVGIINGLFCLNFGKSNLCVWNPALNIIKHFRFHPQAPSGYLICGKYVYSFGYEELNDDYKVVCLQTVEGNDVVFHYEICIYSLKADSWRRIDDQLKGFYLPDPGVFANGKIYWPGSIVANPNRKIVSIDMSSEKVLETQPPEYDAGRCLVIMGVSGGRPFLLCNYYQAKKVDLWVLDKHGVEESWCKLVSFPYTVVSHNKSRHFFQWVLCISRDSEIVFGNIDGLVVYNWKTKESRKIELDVGIASYRCIAPYVESLVRPYFLV